MDLIAAPVQGRDLGIPRVSGDGPSLLAGTAPATSDPPRERGWTHYLEISGTGQHGSPA